MRLDVLLLYKGAIQRMPLAPGNELVHTDAKRQGSKNRFWARGLAYAFQGPAQGLPLILFLPIDLGQEKQACRGRKRTLLTALAAVYLVDSFSLPMYRSH